MADVALTARAAPPVADEAAPARWTLIGVTVGFLGLFLLAPLLVVAVEASRKGWDGYLSALADPDARAAVALTLLIATIVVPLNAAFGLCAAWAISKFQFRGKNVLVSLIDLPFSVSPVVSGLVFVLLFGAKVCLGRGSPLTRSTSSSPCRAWCSRRCSSPFRSPPAR